jgi:hemolysin III
MPRCPRPPSFAEEIANSVTHGLGLAASLVGLPVLVLAAAGRGDALAVAGASVFGATLVALYAASTTYHAWPPSRTRQRLRVLDHAAIYLLIAGTYTPFTLGVLRGAWGWTLFGIVWSLAALGVVAKLVLGIRHPRLSTGVYVAMGWLGIVAIRPMMEQMPAAGLTWILAGGLLYTAGVAFYAWERLRYGHAVWHLFVLGGSTCHFVAVLRYAWPASA